jgi:tRNA-binding EMAP/Myf-like protein
VEQRQLVAGIAATYDPQALVGRQIIVVANLEPAKIRGVESQGMLLAADGGSGPIVARRSSGRFLPELACAKPRTTRSIRFSIWRDAGDTARTAGGTQSLVSRPGNHVYSVAAASRPASSRSINQRCVTTHRLHEPRRAGSAHLPRQSRRGGRNGTP